ncbi:hypothetical protein K2173_027385 [Erythroxylum novogranatense]|uniref:Uncharacterized protein n=1 Tax=Erythroxylum novogranatense TaxID=1862640 RepID=A0AAV8U1I4_9ROSI|nr:hypothetical protein K2173_027385 [Erythroxylum novogranatense]
MYEQEENSGLKSWLSASATSAGAVDPVLYNDLVQMFPLVESLFKKDRKLNNSSFTRRASMIYTRTPSRDSLSRKMIDPRGRNATESMPMKKKNDLGYKEQGKYTSNNKDGEVFSIYSSDSLATEKDQEEPFMLRKQVEDLQKKLLEKDELLKLAEASKSQTDSVHIKFNELKQEAAEKNSLIKMTQQQLHDTKIKLADKQAALEKIQWEAMTSNKRVEKLQDELDSVQGGMSSLVMLFKELSKNDCVTHTENYDVKPCHLDCLPDICDLDDMKIQKMERAREAYVAAVSAAKEKRDEESLAAASRARLHLQSFVFRSNSLNLGDPLHNRVL